MTSGAQTQNMIAQLSVEDGFAKTTHIAMRAVERFRTDEAGWPDLRCTQHLETMGVMLDLPAVERRQPEITGYDIAYALLRYLLETAPYSPMRILADDRVSIFADAILGRVYYNPPAREFLFRQERLDALLLQEDSATLGTLINRLANFLHELNGSVSAGIASSEAIRTRITDRFCNPYLWIESRLRKYYFANDQGGGGLRGYYGRRAVGPSDDTGTQYF